MPRTRRPYGPETDVTSILYEIYQLVVEQEQSGRAPVRHAPHQGQRDQRQTEHQHRPEPPPRGGQQERAEDQQRSGREGANHRSNRLFA